MTGLPKGVRGGPEAEDRVRQLCQAQQHLDALAAALHWQLAATTPEETKRASELAAVLWERLGFSPIPPERHDYSLLHKDPQAKPSAAPDPMKMLPFSVEDGGGADEKYPVGARRHPAALVGHRCPVVDAKGGLTPEVQAHLSRYMDIRNPMPCIIKNLPLFQRAVDAWDVSYLAKHMGDQLYHTFASDQSEKRFAYFFEERNESGYESPPIAQACKMTFAEFLAKQRDGKDGKAYYLQTPVLRYEGDVITCAKFDDQMESDLHKMDNRMMNRLAEMGNFGAISRNQLFVSFSDFLTAVHYDQQHNLYLQVRGAKRFLLFDAKDLPAMYPYPVHHPLDRKGMVDLERPDLDGLPRSASLAGRGVEALLERGDILFMPMSWFHLVHSIGGENVSLNYWFHDSGVLFHPGKALWPLAPPSVVELSRHVEYFVAEQVGPNNVGPFVTWWLGGGNAPSDSALHDRWRLMRNYVLYRLSRFPRSVSTHVLASLDPRRWQGHKLRDDGRNPKAIQGFRAEHGVSALLEGLTELNMGLFRCNMTGQAMRVLGRAIDVLPREKLRVFLECWEEVLLLLKAHTDWKAADGAAPDPGSGSPFVFGRDEARRMPIAQLRMLDELCELASSPRVKVATVDNGFFANWLQVLDARLFGADGAPVDPDWVLTGQEREFNYGAAGDDVFGDIFDTPPPRTAPPPLPLPPAQDAGGSAGGAEQGPFVVYHRYNFLLINVFRGQFLRGAWAARRRRLYAAAAREVLRPNAAALAARDAALASVVRAPGAPLIGVHKRVDNPGTARMQFRQVMPTTQAYIDAVKLLAVRRGGASGGASAVVVLATDDVAAVAAFREAFGADLVCRNEVKRSEGGVDTSFMPVEVHGQKGKRLALKDAQDCLVDALLLAACDAFVHADSNVTIAAGIMNPDAEAVHILDLVPDAPAAALWPGYRKCKLPC